MYNATVKTFMAPPIDEKEILRYAGSKAENENLLVLLRECLLESESVLSYLACYRKLSVDEFYSLVDGAKESKGVQTRLCGCNEVILFAASVGLGIDRLMEKYGKTSPVKALLFQAVGAERIESLCEALCAQIKTEYGEVTARFSAGYGDFPLSAQRDIVRLLDCPKHIGVSLTDSLLMTPTKSVTAFVGIGKSEEKLGCEACEKKDCACKE